MRTEILAASCLSCFLICKAEAQTFEIVRTAPDSNLASVAANISSDGKTAVGFVGPNAAAYGMRWTVHGSMSPLDPTQNVSSESCVIMASNDDASVVAGYKVWLESKTPFVFSQAFGLVDLGDLLGGNLNGAAMGIDASGEVVVGWSIGETGREAFRWTPGEGMVGLGSFPGGFFGEEASEAKAVSLDGNVTVGSTGTGSYIAEPCRWIEGVGLQTLGTLPGSNIIGGTAYGTNKDGSVVVGNSSSSAGVIAFRWTESGGMEPLGDLPGGLALSTARAVSGDGQIVVGSSGSSRINAVANVEAFIWTQRDGMRSLMDVIENDFGIDLGDFHLECAYGISPDGRVIVGTGINEDGVCQGWVLTLPKRMKPLLTSKAAGR